MSKKIFVIGSGRSGTHWLAYTLKGHPDIAVTIEKPKLFGRVTAVAMDPRKETLYLPWLVWMYGREHRRVRPRHYADKSHPALWIAEHLARWLPDSVFLGIQRSPYGTIASTLRHDGVKAWHQNWQDYPVPNRFLGITRDNVDEYGDMSLHAQAALRWKAHRDELDRLSDSANLAGRILVLSYESMIEDYRRSCERIWDFLGVANVGPTVPPKTGSRNRWQHELTDQQIRDIEALTGVPPEA